MSKGDRKRERRKEKGRTSEENKSRVRGKERKIESKSRKGKVSETMRKKERREEEKK